MKKTITVALVATLAAILLCGCFGGRSNPTEMPDSSSATLPTTEMTLPDIMPDMTDGMDSTTGTNSTDDTGSMDITGNTEETMDATDVIDPPESRSRGSLVN